MILLTHSVVGGAIGAVLKSHPVAAFGAGFLSHFVLDAIPHWDYKLESATSIKIDNKLQGDFVINKKFFFDLIKIGTDLLCGLAVSYTFLYGDVFNPRSFFSQGIFWGLVGGILPDFLQFVYYKIKREPLTSLQKFHIWAHTKTRLHDWHVLGPLFQLGIVAVTLFLSRMFY